jgi:hypothetical protein
MVRTSRPSALAMASLSRQIAQRDAHMVLRVEIAERDRHQAAAIDETVAEQRLAERQAMGAVRGRHGRQIDLLAHGIDVDLGRALLPAGHDGGAPGDDRRRQAASGQRAAEIKRAERSMRADDD